MLNLEAVKLMLEYSKIYTSKRSAYFFYPIVLVLGVASRPGSIELKLSFIAAGMALIIALILWFDNKVILNDNKFEVKKFYSIHKFEYDKITKISYNRWLKMVNIYQGNNKIYAVNLSTMNASWNIVGIISSRSKLAKIDPVIVEKFNEIASRLIHKVNNS